MIVAAQIYAELRKAAASDRPPVDCGGEHERSSAPAFTRVIAGSIPASAATADLLAQLDVAVRAFLLRAVETMQPFENWTVADVLLREELQKGLK